MKPEHIKLSEHLIISRVLTGLWQIADMERDGNKLDLDAAARSMAAYGDQGFTTFDMADHYGSAELIAGIYRKKYAGKHAVQLLTKWVPTPGAVTKEDVRKAVQRALDRLQADRIDLMQFHAWNYADPRWLDCLFWLHELSKEGLIQCLGLTNFDTAHLRIVKASGIPVVSNQICYSLLDQRAAGEMASYCQKNHIKILAFGTLAGGFLSERWLGKPEPGPDDLKTWSLMKYKRFIDQAGGWEKFQSLLRTLKSAADRNEVSISNVASRFILDSPGVGGVIIGARLGQSAHIEENLQLRKFKIDPKSRKEIESALTQLTPIPGDCGDEYRKPPFLTASGDLSHHVESFPSPYTVKSLGNGTDRVLSGTVWEDLAGFSRAIRRNGRILISGTTATHGDAAIGGNDPVAQTHFIIDKIEGALQSLGASIENVVRTRIYVRSLTDWEGVARAHGQRFRHVQPANTMVRAHLIGEEYLVEMEAEAML